MSRRSIGIVVIAVTLVAAVGGTVHAQSSAVTLSPSRDNTLYENAGGSVSNGAGQHMFAGNNSAGSTRRAVLAFDLADAVPSGSTVVSASLELSMSRSQPGDQRFELRRLTADWGEGTSGAEGAGGSGARSTPGDATWIHRSYDTTLWANPGGDFSETVSAAVTVAGAGRYIWTSPQMATDVQRWLDEPSSNFGWVVLGNESQGQTAKRFDSRENAIEANRPTLTIEFTPLPPTVGDMSVSGLILALLASTGGLAAMGGLAITKRGWHA